jgi:lipoprotein-releasing system ATP-binding protein
MPAFAGMTTINNMDTVLHASNLTKYFHEPETFKVLNDVSFSVEQGEFVSIVGKSGCGKSTLLYVLSTMDTDFEGALTLNGTTVHDKSQDDLSRFRGEHIGFVFQFHYLLPEFTCLENVMIPALKLNATLNRYSPEEIRQRALDKRASKLSGGQQQRVAIARALINDPTIIMGDEPTGNLDSANTNIAFDIFRDLCRNHGQTLICVTHDKEFAMNTDRTIEMSDGRIISGN